MARQLAMSSRARCTGGVAAWGRSSIFDRQHRIAGDFVYEGETNRAVSVHTAAMTETLRKLYGADKLVDELLSNGVK